MYLSPAPTKGLITIRFHPTSSSSNTPIKKRKLTHCITGSSPGVVFAAVSFASPEKTDKGDIESNAVIMVTEGSPVSHGNEADSGDEETNEVDSTTNNSVSKRIGEACTALPTSTYIPNSPHLDMVNITSQSNTSALSNDGESTSYSKSHDSPSTSRLLSLQPRKASGGHGGGLSDAEMIPSLCSSTSGLQSESSPESEIKYLCSNDKEMSIHTAADTTGEHLQLKSNPSPMKIHMSSPKPNRDDIKSSFRSDRNVTFSPVPPVKYHYSDDSHGRLINKQSTEHHNMAFSVSKSMSPAQSCPISHGGIKMEDTHSLSKAANDQGDNTEDLRERNRDGGITPTNFAFDYGKIELTSSFDDANGMTMN